MTRILTLEEDLEGGRVGTVVGDDDTRAANDLAGLALAVNLGETGPLAEDLGVRDLDELDVVLGAESLDELGVLGLGAGLVQDAEMGLSLVEGFGALSESSSQSVVDLHDQNSRLSIL
jgi:hypothetical protein